MTSFDALRPIKSFLHEKKVGHLGTLDPLASGILPVAVGSSTKLISKVQLEPKKYVFKIFFGATSLTLDSEGVDLSLLKTIEQKFTEPMLLECLKSFGRGYLQVPPIFSAKKIGGVRAYKLARAGQIKEENLEPKLVEIFDCEITEFGWPISEIEVLVGKGFYVRSFVRDIATRLDTLGFMLSLERQAVGNFTLDNALFLADLEQGEDVVLTKAIKFDEISVNR